MGIEFNDEAIDTVIPAWKMAQKNRAITTELNFHRTGDPV
jgi:hypothetical protein